VKINDETPAPTPDPRIASEITVPQHIGLVKDAMKRGQLCLLATTPAGVKVLARHVNAFTQLTPPMDISFAVLPTSAVYAPSEGIFAVLTIDRSVGEAMLTDAYGMPLGTIRPETTLVMLSPIHDTRYDIVSRDVLSVVFGLSKSRTFVVTWLPYQKIDKSEELTAQPKYKPSTN
jgi:hypothetical protein